jgi:hypothetical protein
MKIDSWLQLIMEEKFVSGTGIAPSTSTMRMKTPGAYINEPDSFEMRPMLKVLQKPRSTNASVTTVLDDFVSKMLYETCHREKRSNVTLDQFILCLNDESGLVPTESYGDICSICLRTSGGERRRLSCGHMFHKTCLETFSHCPLCRTSISELKAVEKFYRI